MSLNRFWTQNYEIFITRIAIHKNRTTLHNGESKRNMDDNIAFQKKVLKSLFRK